MITSTEHEYSLTLNRPDGTKIDVVCDNEKEVVFAHLDSFGDTWTELTLSMPEAEKLRDYLTELLG